MYLSGMAHPHCSTNLNLGTLALNKLEKVLDDVEGAMVTSASGAKCAVAVDAGTCTPRTVVAVAGAVVETFRRTGNLISCTSHPFQTKLLCPMTPNCNCSTHCTMVGLNQSAKKAVFFFYKSGQSAE